MKRFLKSLIGFPLGMAMLVLSYILVYVIDGETTYIFELSKLTDIHYLICQVLCVGVTYMVVFEIGLIFGTLPRKDEITYKRLFQWILKYVVAIIILFVAEELLDTKGVMENEVGVILMGLAFIVWVVFIIRFTVVTAIEDKKINQALKEKHEKNKSED